MTAGFRPSCVVNFRLRFDEDVINVLTPTPVSAEQMIENVERAFVTAIGLPDLMAQKDPTTSYLQQRVPKSGNFEMPGYRQAGTFNFRFDFAQLPIDPRIVRACAVDIHTGSIDAANFGRGMLNQYENGHVVSVMSPSTDNKAAYASTMRMSGLVDEWKVTHGHGGSEVEIRGRDLRGILLDIPVDVVPGHQQHLLEELDLSKPIHEVVIQILAANVFFQTIMVVINPAEWDNGKIPSPKDKGIVPRREKGAKGTGKGGQASIGEKMSYWDLIVKMCFYVGAVPYFSGVELHIRPLRQLYEQATGPIDPVRNPSPFKGGGQRLVDAVTHAQLDPPLRWRRIVYGRDVETLTYDRKYQGWRKPNYIRVVGGYNATLDRTEVGFYPPLPAAEYKKKKTGFANSKKSTEATKVAPSNEISENEILSINVPSILTKPVLENIARSIYEEIGRGEIGGSVETPRLSSFGGDASDPDLLWLSPGDGVELLVDTRGLKDTSPLNSTYTSFERESLSAAQTRLTRVLGGDDKLARAILLSTRGQQSSLQRFFRVQTVKYSWDASKGMGISFDFQNYVVRRSQVSKDNPIPAGVPLRVSVPRLPR